ncbi:MAG: hypothetical protein ACFFG0_01640 [Candidatus Thorarchaeota archaeon]
MKKFFGSLITIMFVLALFTAPAMAGWFSPVEVDGHYTLNAPSFSHSESVSIWGWGNDNAEAIASGNAGGTVDTHGVGLFYVKEKGELNAFDISNTHTFAKDFGLTSISGACAYTEGEVTAKGEVYGLSLGMVENDVYVDGYVDQASNANENWGQTFANGGNESRASFLASKSESECGIFWVRETTSIGANAMTKGGTLVTVDPFGSHRSAYATTGNMTKINSCNLEQASVYGAGRVSVGAGNGMAFAGGTAHFQYNGSTFGMGGATVNAAIHTAGNYSSANVSGSSFAISH